MRHEFINQNTHPQTCQECGSPTLEDYCDNCCLVKALRENMKKYQELLGELLGDEPTEFETDSDFHIETDPSDYACQFPNCGCPERRLCMAENTHRT